MDTSLDESLEALPKHMRRTLLASCDGDWSRVVFNGPGDITVHNNATLAARHRARLCKAKAIEPYPAEPTHERVPDIQPPAWRPTEPPAPQPPARQRMRAASQADLLALREVVEKKQAESIVPGTNVIKVTDHQSRVEAAQERFAWSEIDPTAPQGFDWSTVDLGTSAAGLCEKLRAGLPAQVSFGYLPDVLALEMDLSIVEDALRHPERVEVRPESFHKIKGYPILGFYRGDVAAILGLRDPHRPTIIAAYAHSRLENDVHRVGHTGGGGRRAERGNPRNPKQLVTRLRAIGCEVVDASDTSEVTYRGQVLGKISTAAITPRATTDTDWQRMQRKVHAIDQRAHAAS